MGIFVTQSSLPDFTEYTNEIKDIFDSYHITNRGPKHKTLERQLRDYLNVSDISLFVNGHMALEMAIQALELTGEVITTPYTFVSTTHAIVRNGLTPVFCDINEDDYTINVDLIESLITEKTSAIIPVHVYGNICNVEAIEAIAKKHNLKVIYDAAHAFGVTYKNTGIGNFGDISMFSFHATKVFNTIEGGALTFKNSNLAKKLQNLKNFGIQDEETISDVGGNAKMDEFRAAMGICNLRHIEEELSKRKQVFEKYIENLRDINGIKTIQYRKEFIPNYSYFPIYVDEPVFGSNRDEVYNKLKENEIHARKYFYPATNTLDCYKGRFDLGNTPVAQKASKNILTLPMYSNLKPDDIDRICSIISALAMDR